MCCWTHSWIFKINDTNRLTPQDTASEDISGEDFLSHSNEDDGTVEDFGTLINASTNDSKEKVYQNKIFL